MSLILIDWLSPAPHAEFNQNLYKVLRNSSVVYVYSEKLVDLDGECVVQRRPKTRLFHALSVLKICWKHRKDQIFFITYDDLFVWIAQFFVKTILCFEHKTTPNHPFWDKHAVWQRVLFYRLERLCQSKAQLSMLAKMGQRCHWLGLPIPNVTIVDKTSVENSFLFVSEQISIPVVQSIVGHCYGKIKLKKSVSNTQNIIPGHGVAVEFVSRFNLPEDLMSAEALVLSIDSSVRGSGWYTEAIKFGVPLVIVAPGQQYVFESTYPNYPYVKGDLVEDADDLKNKIALVRRFDGSKYADSYMGLLQNRVASLLSIGE